MFETKPLHVSCYPLLCVLWYVTRQTVGHTIYLGTRLWRVPATLPYPDFFFTTRTLPGNFSKISGFRVVTIHAVFSLGLYQWCQPLSSCRKGFSKDCKHLHICPFTRFRNIKVKKLYKYRVRTNISVIFMGMALVLNVQKVKKEWAGIKY